MTLLVEDHRMPVREALHVLADARRADQVVVTHQGASRIWPLITEHSLDFHHNPSTMGGAIPLGLGLVLAQPGREVTVVTGDGSLLMSLGCLVSVVASKVSNLSVVLLDNGIYEVTGGQKTAASQGTVDFEGLARAAGFSEVRRFDQLPRWRDEVAIVFSATGPRFVWLRVEAADAADLATPGFAMREQSERLRKELVG